MFSAKHRKMEQGNADQAQSERGTKVQSWIRRHLIDEDPYDQEAWTAALLQTQNVLNKESFPKELY